MLTHLKSTCLDEAQQLRALRTCLDTAAHEAIEGSVQDGHLDLAHVLEIAGSWMVEQGT
jgi:hypothetical protein